MMLFQILDQMIKAGESHQETPGSSTDLNVRIAQKHAMSQWALPK